MLASLVLVAALQHQTAPTVQLSGAVTTSRQVEMSAHKRHELHLAHLHYLHWLHEHRSQPHNTVYTAPRATVTADRFSPGVYSCGELETLWVAAGGSRQTAFLAAEIAKAESGGISWAVSPTDDFGLWQINGSHGALATLDPYGNARAAVVISDSGSDWFPWVTYVTGAYLGRCLSLLRLTVPVRVTV